MEEKLYRIKMVSELTGISKSQLWKEVQMGNLESIKISPRITLFSSDAINSFIENKKAKYNA